MKPLWEKASEIIRQVFPWIHSLYQSFELPEGMECMAGEWMGMAINTGTLENPVKCEEHRDVKAAKYGISCLCPFGDFTGGHVILWELKTEVVLRPGDLLFLRDNLITHSNSEVIGVRHSIVAFTWEDIRRIAVSHRESERNQGRAIRHSTSVFPKYTYILTTKAFLEK
jgi:hypothetical protein